MKARFLWILSIGAFCIRSIMAATAVLVADLNPGSAGSYPSNFTVFNNKLDFSAYTLDTGRELWVYDGANVTLVADINDTKDDIGFGVFEGNDSLPSWLTPFNDALYFSAYEPRRGAELWRTTGTVTERVADINPDANDTIKIAPNSSWPSELTVFNGSLYFSADNSTTRTNYELWKYDGSVATLVTNIHVDLGTNYSSYPNHLMVFNGGLYFMANNGINGFELWKHDGVNTVMFDINPGDEASSSYPKNFTAFVDSLYFPAVRSDVGYELWKTDGATVTLAADINGGAADAFPDFLTVFNGALYFRATEAATGAELWKYDGVTASLAADVNPTGDSYPKNLTVFGSLLCFAADDGVHGWELWKYDGASAEMVADLNPVGDSFPENLIVANGKLYFVATTSDTGYEIFVYDGNSVTLAADINPGPGDSYPQFLTLFNNSLFFRATDDGTSNWEVWSLPVIDTTPIAIQFRSIQVEGADLRLTWTTAGGAINFVQASEFVEGPYNDISGPITVGGSGEVTAEYVDAGAASNSANQFYRIRSE
jgi:ELWxxDGT repeat protein